MSKYFYNNYTIDDYIVNTKGESKTADYCITNMSSNYTSKTMGDYKYCSSNDNIINYISVSIPYTTSSSPTGNLYSIKSSSPATITAPDGHVIMAIEGTKFTSSNGSHGTNYVTVTPSIASNRKTATISLGGSIQGTSGSALMTVNCTITYSTSKNYLTLPENDCRFLVSEEMQKGYHIDDFVNKLKTPYLPFFETTNGAVGLELRCCDYAYNNMMQRYWEDLSTVRLQLSIEDLTNYPEVLTITRINQRTGNIIKTEKISLASPILHIIGQAAGGNGGQGYFESPWVGYDKISAGGAGGSGAAFMITVDVVKAIKDYTNITLYAEQQAAQIRFNNDNYISANPGGYGQSATSADGPRAGGDGGTYTIIGNFKDKDYIKVCGTNGTKGSSGVGGTNSSTIYRQASGNTSREIPFHITDNYIMHNIYPYSNTGTLLQEDPTGLGEPVPYMSDPPKEKILAGGPGGAPSPLFPGKSHHYNENISETNWPGAGGCGQSGYWNMGNAALEDCHKGGPAAIWLFYVATDNVCDTNNYDHEYEEKSVIIQSTCTSEGKREVVCPRCGKTKTQTISKLPHNYGDWITDVYPTCTTGGTQYRICTDCTNQDTSYIPPLGHNLENWEYNNKDRDGSWIKKCGRCGETILKGWDGSYDIVNPNGRTYHVDASQFSTPISETDDGVSLDIFSYIPETNTPQGVSIISQENISCSVTSPDNQYGWKISFKNPTGSWNVTIGII